jgi:hypothetical protein
MSAAAVYNHIDSDEIVVLRSISVHMQLLSSLKHLDKCTVRHTATDMHAYIVYLAAAVMICSQRSDHVHKGTSCYEPE